VVRSIENGPVTRRFDPASRPNNDAVATPSQALETVKSRKPSPAIAVRNIIPCERRELSPRREVRGHRPRAKINREALEAVKKAALHGNILAWVLAMQRRGL